MALLIASSLSALVAVPGYAAETAAPASDVATMGDDGIADAAPSVTSTLIKRLIKKGVLKKEDAADLLLLAEADAAEARAQSAMTQAALARAAAAELRAKAYASQIASLKRTGVAADEENEAAEEAPAVSVPAPHTKASARKAVPKVAEDDSAEAAEPDAPAPAPARKKVVPRAAEAAAADDVELEPAPAPKPKRIVPKPAEVANEDAAEVEPAPAPKTKKVARKAPPAAIAKEVEPDDEPVPEDTVRVTYVPEYVKKQIREEVKQEVMETARQENWAAPRMLPDWTMRFKFFGDLRTRYDGQFYPTSNATGNGSSFWNFNAINTASTPYDTSFGNVANPPYVNVDQNRNRARLRARLGAAVDLSEGFTGGLRIGTGENNSPVTQNQTLGGANNAQGGDFSKYALWLDRAFLKYELWGQPDKDLAFTVGRFDNPFMSTSMIWADELGFDGAVGKWKFPATDWITPFVTAGAFPVFNTDLSFATNNPSKFKSYDKWLMGGQTGAEVEVSVDVNFKFAVAYYLFRNVEGKVSTPYTPLTATDAGDTDASRPSFAQRGNTYIALRDITLDATNSGTNGVTNQWQYFGLATPFHELTLDMQLDFNQFQPFQISLFGEYVKNIAFDRNAIEQNGPSRLLGPVNNNLTNSKNESIFGGGSSGFTAGIKLGDAALTKRWDWNLNLAYRRIESDAVVDGFNDSDFGTGGTNLKGFIVATNLALGRRVWVTAKWMSATAIAGPSFKNDTLQFDINGKF